MNIRGPLESVILFRSASITISVNIPSEKTVIARLMRSVRRWASVVFPEAGMPAI